MNSAYWAILLNYESSQLVRVQFKKFHGRELNAAKSREICAGFAQFRNYMQAAATADRSVRPLLVYYGVLNASRALTLFRSTSLREAGLAQAHGLSVDGWDAELGSPTGSVANLRIKTNIRGTFQQLLYATNYTSYLRNNSSAPNYNYKCAPLSNVAEFTAGELLARMPEVRTAFERWRTDRQIVGIWPQQTLADGREELRVEPPYTIDDVKNVISGIYNIECDSGGLIKVIAENNYTIPTQSDEIGVWDIGHIVGMTKFSGGHELSKIGTAFLASYMLGMLVRYYPSRWIDILQNQRHDDSLPTLLAVLNYIEIEFPRYIVEFLETPKNVPVSS